MGSALDALIERAGWDAEALARRPSSGAWTGAEVLEHVATMHRFVFVLIDKIARQCRARLERDEPWPTAAPGLDVVAALADSGRSWPHPQHMTPTGALAPEQSARGLAGDRARVLAWLDAMPAGEGTLHRIRMSRVGEDGGDDRLDLYQWIELVLRHAERHARQIDRAARR